MKALGKDPKDGGQTWLAAKVGMKPQGIQSILAGGVAQPRKIREIAAVLRTTPEYLLGETNDPRGHMIRGEAEILSMLGRIDGLSDHDIDVAFSVIKNALDAKSVEQGQEASRDQSAPASPRHGSGPSGKKAPQQAF